MRKEEGMHSASDKFFSARVLNRREISTDLWVMRVDPGGEFKYLPGQYATLGVMAGEKRIERPYSIASSPHEKFLEFFVELVPHGQVTPRLYDCHAGDPLTLRKAAKGHLTLDFSGPATNHFLIATVTGVCPFVSYVRHLQNEWKESRFRGEHKLFLLQGASRSPEFGYADELVRAAADSPWLTYVPTVSRPQEDKAWTGEVGRVDDLVRKYTDLWNLTPDNSRVYLCGHPGMIENTMGIVKRRGWRNDTIKQEAFFPMHD
jgi:ferredoxin/flavodoxin---NADP+ reductase